MKSKIKRFICLLAAVVFVLSMTAPVFADSVPIDPVASGSITIEYKDRNESPINGMKVILYQVASVTGQTDPNAASGYDIAYILTDAFRKFDQETGTIRVTGFGERALNEAMKIRPGEGDSARRARWQSIAQTLSSYAQANAENGVLNYTANGRVDFSNLAPGLYLLLASGITVVESDSDYRYTYAPTWVMLPQYENGVWEYSREYSFNNNNALLRPKYTYDRIEKNYEVRKRWLNDSGLNVRPDKILVDIFRDGVLYRTVVLNEANNWYYTWTGGSHVWEVVERSTPSNYTVSIDSGKMSSFTIDNTYDPPPLPPAVPKVYKKIMENNEKGYSDKWQDGADYDIGDEIPFRLIGTVPNISSYSTYYYRFNDTMEDTLKFNPNSVRVYLFTPSSSSMEDYDVETEKNLGSKGTLTELTSGYSLAKNSTDTAFQVIFSNLKNVSDIDTSGGQYIIVEYTAALQPTAVIGTQGNANEVTLTYTDSSSVPPPPDVPPPDEEPPEIIPDETANTNSASSSTRSFRLLGAAPSWGSMDNVTTPSGTATTDKDEVMAYTWELTIQKVDAADTARGLQGAKFLVFYAGNEELINEVLEAATSYAEGGWNSFTDAQRYYIRKADQVSSGIYRPNGLIGSDLTVSLEANLLETGENGLLKLTGVDQGYYFLVEEEAPGGYNKIYHPVFVQISTEHICPEGKEHERLDPYVDGHVPDTKGDQISAWYLKTDDSSNGKYTADSSSLENAAKVMIRNNAGSTLPETGGEGTALLYIAGASLMAGAAAVMIIRRQKKGR